MAYVPYADQVHELHDPHSFVTKYIWSQDHKVIAIQYGGVAILVEQCAKGTAARAVAVPLGRRRAGRGRTGRR